MTRQTRTWRLGTVAVAAGSLVAASVAAMPAGAAPAQAGCDTRANNTTAKLLECVRVEGVVEHLEALQAIADANGGTRASETPGYDASVDYVVETLEAAGWAAEVEPFTYDAATVSLTQLTPTAANYTAFDAAGTGEGDVTRRRHPRRHQPDRRPRQHQRLRGRPTSPGFLRRARHRARPARHLPRSREGHERGQAAGASAVVLFNQGDATAATGDRFGAVNPTLAPLTFDHPGRRDAFAAGESPRRGRVHRPRRRRLLRGDLVQRHRRARRQDRRQRRHGGRPPGLRPRGPRHQRQRQRLRRAARARAADGQVHARRTPCASRGGARRSSVSSAPPSGSSSGRRRSSPRSRSTSTST